MKKRFIASMLLSVAASLVNASGMEDNEHHGKSPRIHGNIDTPYPQSLTIAEVLTRYFHGDDSERSSNKIDPHSEIVQDIVKTLEKLEIKDASQYTILTTYHLCAALKKKEITKNHFLAAEKLHDLKIQPRKNLIEWLVSSNTTKIADRQTIKTLCYLGVQKIPATPENYYSASELFRLHLRPTSRNIEAYKYLMGEGKLPLGQGASNKEKILQEAENFSTPLGIPTEDDLDAHAVLTYLFLPCFERYISIYKHLATFTENFSREHLFTVDKMSEHLSIDGFHKDYMNLLLDINDKKYFTEWDAGDLYVLKLLHGLPCRIEPSLWYTHRTFFAAKNLFEIDEPMTIENIELVSRVSKTINRRDLMLLNRMKQGGIENICDETVASCKILEMRSLPLDAQHLEAFMALRGKKSLGVECTPHDKEEIKKTKAVLNALKKNHGKLLKGGSPFEMACALILSEQGLDITPESLKVFSVHAELKRMGFPIKLQLSQDGLIREREILIKLSDKLKSMADWDKEVDDSSLCFTRILHHFGFPIEKIYFVALDIIDRNRNNPSDGSDFCKENVLSTVQELLSQRNFLGMIMGHPSYAKPLEKELKGKKTSTKSQRKKEKEEKKRAEQTVKSAKPSKSAKRRLRKKRKIGLDQSALAAQAAIRAPYPAPMASAPVLKNTQHETKNEPSENSQEAEDMATALALSRSQMDGQSSTDGDFPFVDAGPGEEREIFKPKEKTRGVADLSRANKALKRFGKKAVQKVVKETGKRMVKSLVPEFITTKVSGKHLKNLRDLVSPFYNKRSYTGQDIMNLMTPLMENAGLREAAGSHSVFNFGDFWGTFSGHKGIKSDIDPALARDLHHFLLENGITPEVLEGSTQSSQVTSSEERESSASSEVFEE